MRRSERGRMKGLGRLCLGSSLYLLCFSAFAPPLPGDQDGDTDVDVDDIAIILAARNQPASGPADSRDLDGDGTVTTLDARIAAANCTRPLCAIGNNSPSASDAAFTLAENSADSTAVGTVSASDPDPGDTLGYAITAGNTGGAFAIDPLTGAITVASSAALDFEATPSFSLTVTVTDDGAPPISVDATVTVDLTDINEAPSFTAGADQTVLEDAVLQTVAGWAVAIDDGDGGTQVLNFNVTGNTSPSLFNAGPVVDPGTGNLTYTPAADANGSADITLELMDDGGTAGGGVDTSAPQTFTINVTAVNDAPSFSSGGDVSYTGAALAQTAAGWATGMSAGPADESGQVLTFNVTGNTNPGLFSAGPAVDAISGNLTYTPAPGASGVATITLELMDDGGMANGGADTSAATMFTLSITTVNQEPSFTAGGDETVPEDAGPQTVSGWATSINDGDGGTQLLSFNVTGNTNPSLFSAGPLVDATSGDLTYTPAANANGSADITLALMDDGGTANGGDDTSAPQTFTINVTAQDDPVVAVDDTGFSTDEDTSLVSVGNLLTNDSAPDGGKAAVAGMTTSAQGAAVTINSDGTFDYDPTGSATLQALSGGTVDDTFNYTARDVDGDMAVATVTVTVTGVNDPPAVTVDSYSTVGNTELAAGGATPTSLARVVDADGVLANDADGEEGSPLSVVEVQGDTTEPFTGTTSLGGQVNVAADGSFVYVPPVGVVSMADTFTYVASDGTDTALGTATINITADRIWYVHNDPAGEPLNPAGGDGRSNDPFDVLNDNADDTPDNDAREASGDGDILFVFEGNGTTSGQNAGISLKNGQKLLGHAATTLDVNGVTVTLPAAGNKPRIENTVGDGVEVATTDGDRSGVEIRNLDITGSGNAIEVRNSTMATHAVGLVIDNNFIRGAGAEGIDLNPDGDGAFTAGVTNNAFATASPTGNAIDLTTVGTSANEVRLDISGNTDVTSSGGDAIHVDGSQGTGRVFVTGFAGNTVHANTVGNGIFFANVTFDANPDDADFTGDAVTGGTTGVGTPGDGVGAGGVVLNGVSGDLSFGDLDIGADNGPGLRAMGTATFVADNAGVGSGFRITIPAGSTIRSTGGPALDLDSLTADTTVDSLASLNSTTTGISLTAVDGTATFSLVDIDGSSGAGIALSNVDAPVTVTNATSDVTGAAGAAIDIDQGLGDFTYNGSINNTAGRSVEITNHEGPAGSSAVALTGPITDSGMGIFLDNNDQGAGGTVISLTGALNLTTGASDAFVATNGGVVNVTDPSSNNLAATTTGTGIRIINTLVGGSGVKFTTVNVGDANPAAPNAVSGILLINVPSGSFTATGGAIQNVTDRGLDVQGGSGNVTVGASLSTTATGRSLEVTGRTGGTVTQSGAIDDDGLGVRLDSNTGGTITITGSMDIDTVGANHGFSATGGGTVNVMTGTNDVDTSAGTGIAINIVGTTIGASGVTFRSASANGAPTGIVLDTTGAAGVFEVTGDGASDPAVTASGRTTSAQGGGLLGLGSGGTITNVEDGVRLTNVNLVRLRNLVIGNGAVTRNDAVAGTTSLTDNGMEVNGVTDLVLDNVLISETADHGIQGFGTNVGLTLLHTEILNAGNSGAGPTDGDDAIDFKTGIGGPTGPHSLLGLVQIQSSVLAGMSDTGMEVENFAGALDLFVTHSFIGNNHHSDADCNPCEGDGFLLRADGGGATINMVVEDTVFNNVANDGIDVGNDQASNVSTLTARRITATGNSQADNVIDVAAGAGTFTANVIDFFSDPAHRGNVLFFKADGGAAMNVTVTTDVMPLNQIQGSAIGRGITIDTDGDLGAFDTRTTALVENTLITNTLFDGLNLIVDDMATAAGGADVTLDNVRIGKPLTNVALVGALQLNASPSNNGTLDVLLVNSQIFPGSTAFGFTAEAVEIRETGTGAIRIACQDDGNAGNGTPCTAIGSTTTSTVTLAGIFNENGNQVDDGGLRAFMSTDVFNSGGRAIDIIAPGDVSTP